MKRGGPIPRRTPLPRGQQPMRRTRLKPRSDKRARLYREERVPLVVELLSRYPICQRCQNRQSVDVHELLSRARGGSITDRANLVALCRQCHDHITTHPRRAEAEGWSLSAHHVYRQRSQWTGEAA